MPRRDTSIVHDWYKKHPETTSLQIYQWTKLADRTDHAFRIQFAYEDWLPTDRKTPPPDLVKWVSWYGYIRLRLQTWELPIKLRPQEMQRWREAGYFVTLEDFQESLAKVAAGFLYLAGQTPNLTIRILRDQLGAKLARLDELASLPVDEVYRPEFTEPLIRKRYVERGLKGQQLEDAIEEAVLEDYHMMEVRRFEEPFTLRQQLESFEWGMEKFRMFCMSERSEKVGLPNKELFDALMRIDLNELIAQLQEVDIKLRRIWQNLAKYDCYDLNDDIEPEQFWWRHWKKEQASKQHRD
jgi:hypothetical protein